MSKVTLRVTRIRQRVIEGPETTYRYFCDPCGREVEMLTERQAYELLCVDDQILSQLIAKDRLHVITLVSGIRLICRESVVMKPQVGLLLGD